MNYVKYSKWRNTKTIYEAGQHFLRDGVYCPFPEDTKSYEEYWDEHEHYIRNGYTHEGQYVSGLTHLYTNFCPIWNKKAKRHKFPDFRVIDNDWFDEIESVMGICKYQGIDFRPVGHCTGKTRQSGHSLKAVVPVVYNMHFVPGSKNFIGAYHKTQAQKTNGMYQIYHNHLYEHTAFGKRWLTTTAGEHYVTGYKKKVNGLYVNAGFQSELRIVSFSDTTEKGVGGGVDLFLFEEAGAFPNLLEAVQFVKNACKDGDYATGSILVYGAAGKLDSAKDLEELFYNVEDYDFKGYDNIWDDNPIPGQKVGFFVPNYSCRPPHIDEDGNPLIEAAIAAKEKSLANLKKSNFEKYLQEASQMPNSPKEMFAIRQKVRFESQIIEPHLAFLEARKGQIGDCVDLFQDPETNGIKYRLNNKEAIHDYPIVKGKDKTGTVVIYDYPEDMAGYGRYIAAIDSYNQEDATTDSLGHIIIFDKTTRCVVAEYYGRPESKTIFYRNCLYLQLLYKAKALVENEDTEIVPWYYNKGYEHLLADQPDIIRAIIPGTNVKRAKGIHAAWPLIKAGENKIQRYIGETIGVHRDEKGEAIGEKLGINRIPSLGIVKELYRYVSDEKMNFDRERTLGWLLMYEEETFTEMEKAVVPDKVASFLSNTSRLGQTPSDVLLVDSGYTTQPTSGWNF
jgi:hypothetical protein